jgi:hypothetical protein
MVAQVVLETQMVATLTLIRAAVAVALLPTLQETILAAQAAPALSSLAILVLNNLLVVTSRLQAAIPFTRSHLLDRWHLRMLSLTLL